MSRWANILREIPFFSVFFIVGAAIFVAWSYLYPPNVRMVPLLIGWSTLALSIADVGWRLRPQTRERASGGDARTAVLGVEKSAGGAEQPSSPLGRREIVAVGWLVGLTAGTYLVGFLATSLVYVALSLRLRGEKSWRYAAIFAALVTFGIWFVFSQLMNYELFRGILFEEFFRQ